MLIDADTPAAAPAKAVPGRPDMLLICSCEDTMRPDRAAIEAAMPGVAVVEARHACGEDLDRFRAAAAGPGRAVVACTAMRRLFADIAADEGLPASLAFADIRETAGWSTEGASAGPKMAAMIAMAAEVAEEMAPAVVSLESAGRTLVIGRDDDAVEAARRLADRLDVTVLVPDLAAILPGRPGAIRIAEGRVRAAAGHLGAFAITIDGFAEAAPSSRGRLRPGPSADGVPTAWDVVVDLSGGTALFPAAHLRPGYLRADPGDRAAVAECLLAASDLVGTFDKPRFVTVSEGLCAHSRNRKVGCRRCLDLCPTGAIAPDGDHVAVDPAVCAGCGACAAACPTGAIEYAVPASDALMRRTRALLGAYAAAGGRDPVVLIHDEDHGAGVIDALARFGEGLPATVLPVAVDSVSRIGPEIIAALFAQGATAVRLLTPDRPRHDLSGLAGTIDLMAPVLAALGYGERVVEVIGTDDPDGLAAALGAVVRGPGPTAPATFRPAGPKRRVFDLALSQLHAVAPTPVDMVPLPAGAPFGRVAVATDGCTLCLACTSACPTGALGDSKDRPLLSFDESLCVQCGLCAVTCPEDVITLEPRLRFDQPRRETIKEEEPFCCTACGKPFGTRSTIERVAAVLKGGHWMFGEDDGRLALIGMCDTCRVGAVTRNAMDPYAGPARPKPRTADDYARDGGAGKTPG